MRGGFHAAAAAAFVTLAAAAAAAQTGLPAPKPWTARLIDNWDNGHRISEYVCEENNRNQSNPDGTTTAK